MWIYFYLYLLTAFPQSAHSTKCNIHPFNDRPLVSLDINISLSSVTLCLCRIPTKHTMFCQTFSLSFCFWNGFIFLFHVNLAHSFPLLLSSFLLCFPVTSRSVLTQGHSDTQDHSGCTHRTAWLGSVPLTDLQNRWMRGGCSPCPA